MAAHGSVKQLETWVFRICVILCTPIIAMVNEFAPSEFEAAKTKNVLKVAGYNISSLLSGCGGSRHEMDAESQFACALGCSEEEPSLVETMRPWSDLGERQLNSSLWQSMCTASVHWTQAFMVKYRAGRLFYQCCSEPGKCEPTPAKINGVHTSDVKMLLQAVLEVAHVAQLPDMDFCFNTGDQPFTGKGWFPPVPQFHWVSSPTYWGIPLPNPFLFKALYHGRLGDASDTIQQNHWPWDKRDNRLFWRGGLSGPDNIATAAIETMPRLQLHRLAKKHPELFDVAFSELDEELERALGNDRKSKHWKDIKRGLDYSHSHWVDFSKELPKKKFVINVSAVLSSWRLIQLLASGALLLLQEDADREVAQDWLVPWEHYVPVNYELSDLVTKLRWLQAHDDEARRIAERGFKRFATRVRQEDVHCYVWRALRAVSRIAGPGAAPKKAAKEYKLKKKLRAPGRQSLKDEIAAWVSQDAVAGGTAAEL